MKTKGKTHLRKKINKSKNYTLVDKYIEKTNKYVFDGYYKYIPLPEKIKKEKIKLVEIVPINDGLSFEIHYKYESKINLNKKIDEKNINNYVSIDLGVVNLMTIYDPSGKQIIINGKHLLKINHDYNYKIEKQIKKEK
jgi:transposase